MIDLGALRADFTARYGSEPRLFLAPGRVNLIGEHTDYNDGFVLPAAIDRGTVAAVARRADRRLRVHSRSLNASAELHLDHPVAPRGGHWLDYVEGVARALARRGAALVG